MAGLGGFVRVKASGHICVSVYVSAIFLMCVYLYVLINYDMQRALPKGK